MGITIFDPDERKRNNQLAFLQALQTGALLAKAPSEIAKARGEAKYYENYNSTYLPTSPVNPADPTSAMVGSPLVAPLNSQSLGQLNWLVKSRSRTGMSLTPDPLALEAGKKQIGMAADLQKSKAEKQAGAQQTTSQTGRYLKQYERSLNELRKAFPEIGQVGVSGWMQRQGAKVLTSLDNFPETQALQKIASPFAQQLATEIEGRATDEDRKIQKDAFADALKAPSETNIRLASISLLNLKDKGADISKVVNTLASSNNEVLQAMANQVYEDSPELKPATVDSDELLDKWRNKGGNKTK